MKTKLIRGQMRISSFYFLFVSAIILTIVLFWMQVAFNLMVDFRLQQLESQISPCEVTESPQSEENTKVAQDIDGHNNNAGIEYLGEFTITHYCSCPICCGEWSDGITYTGTQATAGRTIAVDPEVIPLGAEVVIDGQTYVAEDIGGAIEGSRIDIYTDSHEEALTRGILKREVYK